jgi:RNA-directed DNA polymerase
MGSVAHNNGAAGIDGQECAIYPSSDEARDTWRDTLLEELRTRKYRPTPVRRVYIPKGDGKERPLGKPTVKDRVVQTAMSPLLLPILEADSHPHSYAYRPPAECASGDGCDRGGLAHGPSRCDRRGSEWLL